MRLLNLVVLALAVAVTRWSQRTPAIAPIPRNRQHPVWRIEDGPLTPSGLASPALAGFAFFERGTLDDRTVGQFENVRLGIIGFRRRWLRLMRRLGDLRPHGPEERYDQQRYCSCLREGRLCEKAVSCRACFAIRRAQNTPVSAAVGLRRRDAMNPIDYSAQISCAIELQHFVIPSAEKLRRTDIEAPYQEDPWVGTGRLYSFPPAARLILRLLVGKATA